METTPPELCFVIQCRNCKNVVGDSSSFVMASNDPRYVCTDAITKIVSISESLKICDELQSCYKALTCCGCSVVVGRLYTSTRPDLDKFRNLFCLDVEQIETYVFGTANQQTDGKFSTRASDSELLLSVAEEGHANPQETSPLPLETVVSELAVCYSRVLEKLEELDVRLQKLETEKGEENLTIP